MKFPVFDLHCDTALALLGRDQSGTGKLRGNDFHIDLERARSLPGYCQCFACFTTPSQKRAESSAITLFEKEMAIILGQLDKNSDLIRQAYSAAEIEENRKQGIMSALLTIEGTAGIDYNPDLLEDLYKIGFRITTLGWNEQNPLTGSCVTGGGLTELGVRYVMEAQKVGMVVDVSHISDEGFWNIMEIAEKPVIASHSNSRSIWNVPRNLTDDMYRAICKTGGTAGINLYSAFLGEEPNIDTVCDHIFHFLNIAGDDKHISLGADFDGCDALPVGINGVQDYDKLADRLLTRGLTDESVFCIFWSNGLGVIERCSM